MTIRFFTLCICLFFISGRLTAQEINLKKNQEFIIETENTVTMPGAATHSCKEFAFKVIENDRSGNYILEAELIAASQKSESDGRVFVFDSDSLQNISFNTTASLDLLAILHRPFTVILSPKGEVIRVEGMKELGEHSASIWELQSDIAAQLIQNTSFYQAYLQDLFLRLPKNGTLKEGMEWSISGDTTRFRVAADDKNYTIISSNGGNYQLDRKSLLLLSATRKFETTDKGQITRGSSSISRVSATTNPQTIDTAWVNMAVGSSYWSNRLKNNAEEYDSVKIMHYIEKYEKLYADDPVFINNALNALQQADNYEEYDRWLMSTPNSILSNNSSHLHNKLQRAHQSDPGLAFEIVRISNERFPKMLYQWIQHSFSQAFLDGQPDSKEKNASLKLLSLCMNSSDPSLQRQFTPLNTWINAKTNRHQAGALEQPVSAIREMGQQYWTENNLGRYSLLTTYLLKEAGDSLQADDLLNYTIQQLEEAIQDSLSNHQLINRNILAHAYFLKYRAVLPSDSVAALSYLKKAAAYSPKSEAEKAYGSFYDRLFLKSKESYQPDYMIALSRTGKSEDALRALVVEFNADPLKLPKLKEYYQQTFPDKDFTTFFSNEVVNKWDEAPAFSLPNLDDQTVSLEKFAGKWLVVDFWGTWCGPCKEEMPQINAFYQKVKKGAIPGVDFLSIACYDTKDKVTDYLAVNDFVLPALISDGKVQKAYKIKGYPTKVLISPTGKMMILDFGSRWETIIEQFAEAYPGTTKTEI